MLENRFHPLVSIIIPVYNGSNYLSDAINSALAQTYDNIEVIVVNDGSNDNDKTEQTALSYGDKIKYFYKENGGVASALNLGINKMKGEYFSWLSHDDIYFENKIEIQVKKISSKDKFVYGGYQLINKYGKPVHDVYPQYKYPTNCTKLHLYRGLINGCTTLIHKSVFSEIGTFDEKYKTTQDYHLWRKIFKKYKCIYINDLCCKTRIHNNQESKTNINHITEADELWFEMINDIKEYEILEMMSSVYSFYNSTALFLKKTPYRKAYKIAYKKSLIYKRDLNILKQNILVSIIIPFYNDIHLVFRAIKSALNQTHKKIEILVINDGSTANTDKIKEFCDKFDNIYFIERSHVGRSAARNYGIKTSKGEFITFLDADDEFKKTKVESQLENILLNGSFASHTSYIQIFNKKYNFINSGKISGILYPQILSSCTIATPTVMIKKSIIQNKLFPENIHIGEDNIAWIKLSTKTTWCGIETPLTYVHINNTSCSVDKTKLIDGLFNIIKYEITNKQHSIHKENIIRLMCHLVYTYYFNDFTFIKKLFYKVKNYLINNLKQIIN